MPAEIQGKISVARERTVIYYYKQENLREVPNPSGIF
jgi:hypothetical protein